MNRYICRTSLALAFVLRASAAMAVTIPMVPIGFPSNKPDLRYPDSQHPNGVGRVTLPFNIGLTEVTNAQYVAFLNAVASQSDPYGLFAFSQQSDTRYGITRDFAFPRHYSVKPPALGGTYAYDNKPVVNVDYGDALRFANWLHNGQPTGVQDATTTEDGAYTLNGLTVNQFDALAAVVRNSGARWWLPSENEWYKAAYFDPITDRYYDYPTRTNNLPNNNPPSLDTGNSMNTYRGGGVTTGNESYPLTEVGAYTLSASPFGTFDQGGSVFEFTDTVINIADSVWSISRDGCWLFTARGARYWDTGFLAEVVFGIRMASAYAGNYGDYDHDADVDGTDFLKWQRGESTNLGSPGDFSDWSKTFGSYGIPNSLSPAPEPGSGSLLAIFAIALHGRWRHFRARVHPRLARTSLADV